MMVNGQNHPDMAARKIKAITVYGQKYEKGKETGSLKKKSAIVYDQKGNVIEEIDYKDGEIEKSFLYEYDAQNNKIKEVEKNGAGKVVKTTVYTYDNGLRKDKIEYDENNQIKEKKIYQYEKFQ